MEDTKPRLMISKIVLENFKSYAGLKEIGPFHKNFTAVVGPNGSGKSNCLESLLFAFGKRATKMRLKKLSELIHCSSRFQDLKFARVSVHFQDIIDTGDDDYQIVEGSQLVLTRTVTKSSTSTYRLDGQESTYDEVTNMLKTRGIDLEHNRFLILQGEVESIALLKPKGDEQNQGLLEYLEEIIGTNVYVPRIQQAELKLDEIAERVAEKQHRANESEKQMKELEAPKDEAVGYIKLEQESFSYRNLTLSIQRHEFDKKRVELEQETAVLEDQKKVVEEEAEEKKRENKESIDEFNEARNAAKAAKKRMDQLDKKFEEMGITTKDMENQIGICGKKKADMEKKLKTEEQKQVKASADILDLDAQIPQLTEELNQIAAERETVEEQYQEINKIVVNETKALQTKKTAQETQVSKFKADEIKHTNQLDLTRTKREQMIAQLQQREADAKEIAEKYEGYKANLQEREEKIAAAQQEQAGIVQQRRALKDQQDEINAQDKGIDQQIQQLQGNLAQIASEESKRQNKQQAQIEIANAATEGRLKGIVGRLGDLATIPAKYDVAASNCTAMLDYYVCRTIEDAEAVLAFARSKNLGRVNCTSLNKIPESYKRSMNSQFNTPPQAERLFDLITINTQEARPAFYLAFKNTLVMDNLDVAQKVAYGKQRHRVITLDGEIINPTGEMQRQANPQHGKMLLEGQANHVNIEAEKTRLESQLQQLRGQKKEMVKQQSQIAEELVRLSRSDDRVTQEIKTWQNDADTLEKKIRDLDNRRQSEAEEINPDDIAALQEKEDKEQSIVNKIKKVVAKEESKLQDITHQIEQVGGEEFKTIKSRRQQLTKDEEAKDKELVEATKKRAQAEKLNQRCVENIEKLNVDLEAGTAEIENLKAELERLTNEMQAILNDFGQAKEEVNELEAIREQKAVIMEQLKQQFAEIKEKYEKVQSAISAKTDEIERNNNMLKQFDSKLETNKAKYDELIDSYKDLLGEELEEILALREPGDDAQAMETEAVEGRAGNDNAKEEGEEGQKDEVEAPQRETDSDLRKKHRYPVDRVFPFEELEHLQQFSEEFGYIITQIDDELKQAAPNLAVLRDYRARRLDFQDKVGDLNVVKKEQDNIRADFNDLKRQRHEEFSVGFTIIGKKLREMYQLITRGGDAELEFADSTDPFSEGIVFTVRPPLKSWKKMANLSGGEKTISSLALVFALHHYKPTALYVMDEIDAALDYQNVSIIANYIKGRTKNAQFIIVSLRSQNFELADKLVGVYKVNDESQTITIDPIALVNSNSKNPIIAQTVSNIKSV